MHELERDVERRLVRGVKVLGGTAYKWVCPGTVGVPDRIVMWPGGAGGLCRAENGDRGVEPPAEDCTRPPAGLGV